MQQVVCYLYWNLVAIRHKSQIREYPSNIHCNTSSFAVRAASAIDYRNDGWLLTKCSLNGHINQAKAQSLPDHACDILTMSVYLESSLKSLGLPPPDPLLWLHANKGSICLYKGLTHLGISSPRSVVYLLYPVPSSWLPNTEKIMMMIIRIALRLTSAPIVLKIMPSNVFIVLHDCANLMILI